ncbi:hypothetical protein [Pseudalkalibacillus berkeleyi]|uniref:Uncharacterized protein n=1 Tax=Pseudalkalibacillus berkeleyi TaxID=1069813 RepID=A0ABS9GZU9_9BACL|nr:hypothetical protein [Pseudalkalibacillus berkeleyi]MCF6136930.1 hypothetical protein [Pseudalkalibacillus berkeleyi]
MKFKYVVMMTLLPLLIISVYPFLSWHFKAPVERSIQVIDKTVPKEDYREHLGLFWVLDHERVVDGTEEYYQKENDYYGYDPVEGKGDTGLTIAKDVDLIYIADTYGIYTNDLQDQPTGERSQLIYGGLNIFDWNKIIEAKGDDVTLVLEFNSIASPTDKLTRSIVEDEMGFKWSGWVGRYFSDLSSREIPPWLIQNYEKQNDKKWTFDGEGLAFVHESDEVVIIEGENLNDRVMVNWTKAGIEHYTNVKKSEYRYWFDIVKPDQQMNVEANYHIDLNKEGQEKLDAHDIPSTFPAVLHNSVEKKYYFAGDFADISADYYSRWDLPTEIYSVYSYFKPDEAFFWNNYIPVMKQIIEESK